MIYIPISRVDKKKLVRMPKDYPVDKAYAFSLVLEVPGDYTSQVVYYWILRKK